LSNQEKRKSLTAASFFLEHFRHRLRATVHLSSLNLHPFAAFSKAAMSILSISIIAFMTRFAFPASGSANISPRKTGLTCHERPNLSLSQPHRRRSAIGGKFLPEIIDLILGLAVDRERDRFGELELRAAVERDKVDSVERKLHRHYRSWWPSNFFRCFFRITGNLPDPRILKNAGVEFSCLLRFRIEP